MSGSCMSVVPHEDFSTQLLSTTKRKGQMAIVTAIPLTTV